MRSAHAIAIDTMPAGLRGDVEMPLAGYRWRCACGRLGMWRYGDIGARRARDGGARHVAHRDRGGR